MNYNNQALPLGYYGQQQNPWANPYPGVQQQGGYYNTFVRQLSTEIPGKANPIQGGVIAMHIPNVNAQPQKRDVFAELRQQFPLSQEEHGQVTSSIVVELKISDSNSLFIKIEVNDQSYPQQPPRFIFQSIGEHNLIGQDGEIKWQKVYTWQPGKSNLVEACKALINFFVRDPPFVTDPLVQSLNELLKNNEDQQLNILLNAKLQQLVPHLQPDVIQNMEHKKLEEEIKKGQLYKDLLTKLLSLNQVNELIVDRIKVNDSQLQQDNQRLKDLDAQINAAKESLIMSFNRCCTLRERFEKTKILSLLEKLKEQIEEESDQFQDETFSSQMEGIRKSQYDNDCMKYLEIRKQYHRLTIKTEKFSKIM